MTMTMTMSQGDGFPKPPIFFLFLFILLRPSSLSPASAQNTSALAQNLSTSCPLNYTILNQFQTFGAAVTMSTNVSYKCVNILQGLRLVLADYTRTSGFFLVPDSLVPNCWSGFDQMLSTLGTPVNVTAECSGMVANLGRGTGGDCGGIQTTADLVAALPAAEVLSLSNRCNGSLLGAAACSACYQSVVTVATSYLQGNSSEAGSVLSCSDLVNLYAAGVVNELGPSDPGTAWCLFTIPLPNTASSSQRTKYIYAAVGAIATLAVAVAAGSFLYVRRRRRRAATQKQDMDRSKSMLAAKTTRNDTNLVWFTIDEIKAATNNFARGNIVGAGAYGNVFKGRLPDGTEIAVKRFKNCSPAADKEFFHEVEMISSVRHRNLVALRGCCVHTSAMEGHQRIIICDYMPNGSLHDQLFDGEQRMDWPTRRNIAIGMAKGLAYLHQQVQPKIIHRDIKASNILLDAKWNARVGDFGLAKFTPEGVTHVTTRVAGTYGYVAPEYAIYGQLTEKSDVYSFGVVLLELLSGRKALITSVAAADSAHGHGTLITDWAWDLIKKEKLGDILDPSMEDVGPMDEMERFVLVAILCAHSQVFYRPSIDQALKIMENDQALPSMPDRPIPLTSGIDEIEMIMGGSDGLWTPRGYQSFSSEKSCFHPQS